MNINTKTLVACLGLSLLAAVGARADIGATTNIYYFEQTGWDNGSYLSGYFVGTDANGDGVIDLGTLSSSANEVLDFAANFYVYGDTNNVFSENYYVFSHGAGVMTYQTNNGLLVGDNVAADAGVPGADECAFMILTNLETMDTAHNSIAYASGQGQLGMNGGQAYSQFDSNFFSDETPNAIVITSIQPWPVSAPEPSTLALGVLGAAGVVSAIRRKRA